LCELGPFLSGTLLIRPERQTDVLQHAGLIDTDQLRFLFWASVHCVPKQLF